MAKLLASYTLAGRRHRIELVPQGYGQLLIDRPADGPARLVAELAPDEGQEQALAVLHAHRWSAFSGRANGTQVVDPADDPRGDVRALPERNRACRTGRRRRWSSRPAVGASVPTSGACLEPFTRRPYTRGVWGSE